MSAGGIVCTGCGKEHNKTKWAYAERVRRSSLGLKAIPGKAIGDLPTGPVFSFNMFASNTSRNRCGELLGKTWKDYQFWVHRQAHLVNKKGQLGVANYSKNGRRLEVDMDRADRFYFDCDGTTDWKKLARVFRRAGIEAFFHESSSSVRRRQDGDTSLPLKWHVEIPLARSLPNPLGGLDPKSPEARYARSEWKRKYYHVAAVLSALAGFPGVGAVGKSGTVSCGFDTSTSQMCQIRFLGARQHEGGTVPQMLFLEGGKALDWGCLLMATGYDAGQRQADPAVKTIKLQTPEGVKQFQYSGSFDQLDEDIRNGMSVRQFLASFCGYSSPHSGIGHYCCPIHHEGENKRSFHIFASDKLGGNEMWKCFGDCDTAGDVIRLAHLFWGGSRREARGRLASYLGLDPEAYRPQLRVVLGGAPKAPVDTAEQSLPGKKRPEPKQAPDGLKNVSEWAKKHVWRYGKVSEFTRAVSKVLIENKIAADVIASTLWPMAGDYYRKYDSLLAEVLGVLDRCQKGQPATGKTKLRQRLGSWGMFELAKALRRDKRDFQKALTSLVGFGLTVGEDRKWLQGLYDWFKRNPADNPWDKDQQGDAYAKWQKRYVMFLNAIRRPNGCCECEQIVTGEAGRDLGPEDSNGKASKLKRKLVCVSKVCLYCFMLQSVAELELLRDLWKDRPSKENGEDGIFSVEAKGIQDIGFLAAIKSEVSKCSDAKLGITGWGDDGLPTLTYFVTTDDAALMVRSELMAGIMLASGKHLDVKIRRFKTTDEAVGAAIEHRVSFNMHARRLIEERRLEELTEWLWWAARKTPVRNPKNKDALPWPTKAQIQAQVRAKKGEDFVLDVYEGEVLTYTLVHRATGYFLGRRKKIPYTLDQAMDVMAINQGLRSTLDAAAVGGAGTRVA